jgi:hypothetical protein
MLRNNVKWPILVSGGVNMSAISEESVSQEVAAVEICETDDGLVEVGAVSETKGGVYGYTMDLGAGWQFV